MHELSIAHSLVEIAAQAAAKAQARRVLEVHLRIGALSGVEPGALLFCYDLAAEGTLLQGSKLILLELPMVLHCDVCAADVEQPDVQRFRCPRCGTPTGDLRQGRELEVASLEIEGPESAGPEVADPPSEPADLEHSRPALAEVES